MVLKLLVKMKWRLYLHKCTEFRIIIFDIETALFVLFDESVLTTDRNVVDTHVSIMTTT
jgi:hypothetical protein